MFKIQSLFFLIISWQTLISQDNYSNVDQYAISITDSIEDYKKLTDLLTDKIEEDELKIRAIYRWIAHNIKYDLHLYDQEIRYKNNLEIVEYVLENKSGVCEHYSQLFAAMANEAGLNTFVVKGYTRDADGNTSRYGHAWNVTLLGDSYYFIDPTWSAGYVRNGKYFHDFTDNYFLIEADSFIQDHMPFDPIWQHVKPMLSFNQFDNMEQIDFINENIKLIDSMSYELKIEDTIRIKNKIKRIENNGNGNFLVKEYLIELNEMYNYLIYNYNIERFNEGVKIYDSYLELRNRKFKNPKVDITIVEKLLNTSDSIMNKTLYTFRQFKEIKTTISQINIDNNIKIANEACLQIAESKEFINQYKYTPFLLRWLIW